MTTTIVFTDHGQDFLTWTLDEKGIVTDCQPFQSTVWCGSKVLNRHKLKAGGKVTYFDKNLKEVRIINYPIESIS